MGKKLSDEAPLFMSTNAHQYLVCLLNFVFAKNGIAECFERQMRKCWNK